MVSRLWIDNKTRARVYYLSQVKGMLIRKTAVHCNVSRGVVWRIIQRQREKESNRCKNKTSTLQRGRPRKLTGRQGRLLLRCLAKLRHEDGNFTGECWNVNPCCVSAYSHAKFTRLLLSTSKEKGYSENSRLKKESLLRNTTNDIMIRSFGQKRCLFI